MVQDCLKIENFTIKFFVWISMKNPLVTAGYAVKKYKPGQSTESLQYYTSSKQLPKIFQQASQVREMGP